MSVKATAEKNFRRAKARPGKKKGRLAARRIIIVAAAAVLGVYAAYRATNLVLSASVLKVQTIAVAGNGHLSGGEIEALVDGLRGRNILTAPLDEYRDRLLQSPWVVDVALRRILPGTVEVRVSERQPIGVCRLRSELYLIARDGTVLDEYGPEYAHFDLPIIDGVQRKQPRGEPTIDERRTELAARLIEDVAGEPQLAARVSQIDVSDLYNAVVLLDDDQTLLHVGTEKFAERLQAYLDLGGALRERVSEMDYVDLRFDGRIFVRPAGTVVTRAAGPAGKR